MVLESLGQFAYEEIMHRTLTFQKYLHLTPLPHGVPTAFSGFPAFPPPDSYCTASILRRMKMFKQKKNNFILFFKCLIFASAYTLMTILKCDCLYRI